MSRFSCRCNCDGQTVLLFVMCILVFCGTVAWFVISCLVVHKDSQLQQWDQCLCSPPLSDVKFEGSDSIAMRWTGNWAYQCADSNGTTTNQFPALEELWRVGGQTRSKVQSNLASVQSSLSITCYVNPTREHSFTNRIDIVGWGFSLTFSIIFLIGEIGFVIKVVFFS